MPRIPRGQLAEIPARKHCAMCKRWLLTSINFRPRGWLEDGSRPIHISSNCNSCHRKYNNARHQPKITKQVLKVRHDEEFFVLHHKLDAAPFRSWMQQMVQSLGMANVCSAIGVSQRMVYTYMTGSYIGNDGKRRDVNYVQLATVHQYTASMGHQWENLYPHLVEINRPVVRSRLLRKGLSVRKRQREIRRRADARAGISVPAPSSLDHIGDYKRKKKARRHAKRSTDVSRSTSDPAPVETGDLQDDSAPEQADEKDRQ